MDYSSGKQAVGFLRLEQRQRPLCSIDVYDILFINHKHSTELNLRRILI